MVVLRRLWFLCLLPSLALSAQSPVFRPHQVDGIRCVPESFLREYDPITFFFEKAQGPEQGGPVDLPVSWFSMSPKHPGTLDWIDSRTLQFTPATPWSPLQHYSLNIRAKQFRLMTLVRPPASLSPSPGFDNLAAYGDLTLRFSQAIPTDILSRMIRLEVRPLPGLKDQPGTWLTHRDFALKAMEPVDGSQDRSYLLTLHRPLPDGHAIYLQIQIAPDKEVTDAVLRYRYQTRTPLRLTKVGIGEVAYPIAVQGSTYGSEQILNGGSQPKPLYLEFSHELVDPGIAVLKNLVSIEPAIRNLTYEIRGKRLLLNFDRDHDRSYRLRLRQAPVQDSQGRSLTMPQPSQLVFFFPSQPSELAWGKSHLLLERFGPQELPVLSRGYEQADLRIYKIDPLDHQFWPNFHEANHIISETNPPPSQGVPMPAQASWADYIQRLGSPLVSKIVDLPATKPSQKQSFGLDLKPLLAEISGEQAAGTYLVGLRPLDTDSTRRVVRIQVTDLSLSLWESNNGVVFTVTSLKTGKPVAGAQVLAEGYDREQDRLIPLIDGRTDEQGLVSYQHLHKLSHDVYRLTVRTANDLLVLDSQQAPPFFFDNHWYASYSPWLDWLRRKPRVAHHIHYRAQIFSERPLYRPEDVVHLRGIVRQIDAGTPKLIKGGKWRVNIYGPGGKQWTYPVNLDALGSFYLKWEEKNLPTGNYDVYLEEYAKLKRTLGSTQFKKEPYRIPRFEVGLHGPDQARLDRAFELDLVADYYAGGRVAGAEIIWRITRQKTRFRAPNQPGYSFSSDDRFSGQSETISQPLSTKRDKTDDNGAAKLVLDPTTFPESGPMQYVVEAEVRSLDQQSVSAVKSIPVMPPFVLGIKAERVVKDGQQAQAEFLVLGPDGQPLAGQEFRLRLLHRQWHAYVRESDFTTGDVKYETDIVDEPVLEETHLSTGTALTRQFDLDQAGVYVLEMAARDHLGRLQKVVVDFFVMGDTPVAWKKSKDLVFDMSFDKPRYNPGDAANLILKSPFQEASALVLVEAPNVHRYHWVPITAGQGSLTIPITADMARQIPVHALLVRGRIDGNTALSKPTALGSSQSLKVEPRGFQAKIELKHEPTQLPGAKMPLEISLTDPEGQPLNGEVTLWLVDRAVLALAREGNLDPVQTFIHNHESHVRLRDLRQWISGHLPLEEVPGGDGFAAKARELFGKVTVRRNFKTVPYYNPAVTVTNGRARVDIPLPENLTEFAIRAVAVSDNQRFGLAKSSVAIRLPVIVQSALPRFVRPGDQFEAGGIARLLEGKEGPGLAALKVEGLQVDGETQRPLTWKKNQPQPLFFPLKVTREAAALDQDPATVTLSLAVQRDGDGARDAFEVQLPVRPDRTRTYLESFSTPKVDQAISWPGPSEAVRAGTLSREMRISGRAELITLLAALDFNHRYPFGCTEQQISDLFPDLVLGSLFEEVALGRDLPGDQGPLKALLTHLQDVQHENGLFSYWPGSKTNVSLSAYAVSFLLEAQKMLPNETGPMLEKALAALEKAIRSDSPQLMRGYALEERAQAILALTEAGYDEAAYLDDLAALGRNLSLAGEAAVLSALMKARPNGSDQTNRMATDLRQSLNIARNNNQASLQGLQYRQDDWGGPLLTSEARTIAGVTRALYRFDPQAQEVPLLTEALVRMGGRDGWGSTRANTAAIRALADQFDPNTFELPNVEISLEIQDQQQNLNTADKGVALFETDQTANGSVTLRSASDGAQPLIWFKTSYVPEASGDLANALQNGFAVTRKSQNLGPEGKDKPQAVATKAGETRTLALGSIVEEHVRVVNPEDRAYVAISIPFAAGFDPLNPALATAPSYAKPQGQITLAPSYIQFEDDRIHYFYDDLPKGTYDFYLRLKATIAGSFVQPPASAEMMYRQATMGRSPGTRIHIKTKP